MKQHLLAIIAVLAAIILALFSFDTANNQYSTRSYRTYSYNPAPNAWNGAGNGTLSVLQEDNAGSTVVPLTEANPTAGSLSALPEAGSPLGAPPAILATSAMTELTPVQLPPLDAGMVNVTSNVQCTMHNVQLDDGGAGNDVQAGGYRMQLPVPNTECLIAIPYDPSLLPQGFTEDDIQTYVYDRQYHRWVAIQRDSVNEAELLVCSRFRPWEKGLPHTQKDMTSPQDALAQVQDMMSFASQGEGGGDSPLDFINAVLKTPEMPETSAYTPTSIKELKAADPLEGLTLMQPPTANNSGTANLSYPIEIPAGRQGMQPSLALTYSSGGGNGWLGVGWDIPIPSITVETRWGVPRYDATFESEVYVYEGEQLVTKDGNDNFRPMPHRTNQWTNRSALGNEEQFYPRKNEAFDSIVRHGYGPDNYWWSVTHKNGVTDYYGKYVADTCVNNRCVLRVGAGNGSGAIAHWALAESVDPFGNSVKYFYDVEYNAGIEGSTVNGKQIYIDSIRYTEYILNDGTVAEKGHYKVLFDRTSGRTDAIITANRGFKEVTADLLCSMEVLFDEDTIRKYVFFTENNRESMFRTRLRDILRVDSITNEINCGTDMKDLIGSEFVGTRTQLDYYDAPMPDNMFGQTKHYDSLAYDGIMSFIAVPGFNSSEGFSTAIGSSRGYSWSLGGGASIGLDPNVCMSSTGVGGNFNYSRSCSEGALTLVDLNGDGLPDKVWKTTFGVWCRKRLLMPNDSIVYEDSVHRITGVKTFLKETNSTTTWGVQASAGCSYSGGWPTTKSTTSVYFADVNADGLPDIISEDGVLFNTTQQGGDVTFKSYYDILDEQNATEEQPIVVNTTMPCDSFIFDGSVDEDIACEVNWEFYEQYRCNLQGTCPNCPDCDSSWWSQQIPVVNNYLNSDSFRVTFQYDYVPDWSELYTFPTGYTVYKKKVRCSPEALDPDIDAVRVWVAPINGVVQIESVFQLLEERSESRSQSRYVDGVRFTIQHESDVSAQETHLVSGYTNELYSQEVDKDDYDTYVWEDEIRVHSGDILFFRLQSNGNRSFDNVNWRQTINYLEGDLSGYDQYGMMENRYASDEDFSVSGKQFFQAHRGNSSANVEIKVENKEDMGGNAHLVMQFPNDGMVHAEVFTLFPGQSETLFKQLELKQFDSIKFFAFPSENENVNWGAVEIKPHIRYYFQEATVHEQDHEDSLDYYPPVDIQYFNEKGTSEDSLEHRLFGPLYRGWGQFGYNNNVAHATIDSPIHLEDIVIDLVLVDASGQDTSSIHDTPNVTSQSSFEDASAAYAAQGMYNPLSTNTRWVEMHPESRYQAWVGYGNINYVTREMMTNTRIPDLAASPEAAGIPDYDHPVPQAGQTNGGTAVSPKTVRKQNISELKNYSMGAGVPVITIGSSESNGGNKILTDYMDLNGDRYPDFVGEVNVQYSMPWGGIGTIRTLTQHVQGIANSSTSSDGQTFGASFNMPERTLSKDPKSTKITFDGKSGMSGNFGNGRDCTDYTFMDMNGDGLPDKVESNGSVALNIGYSFLPFEQWNSGVIRKGASVSAGLGFGSGSFDVGQASISGGISVNGSTNTTEAMLLDFNGDGLPDRVRRNNNALRVQYNLGNGQWSQEEAVPGIGNLSFGSSYSESTDAGVTMGYTFFGYLKITGGVQLSPYNKTFSKDKEQLTDINGDGHPDYVVSDYEDNMWVRYNMSGKTNLLKRVTNFTGSTIEMDYALSAQCYEKPQRSWNLDKLVVSNTNSPIGGNISHTKFEYENPYYNRGERTDYGYEKVITREYVVGGSGDVPYRYFVEEFNNRDFTKRGRKTRDCIYDAANNPFVEHLYDATVYDFAGGEISEDGCARADLYVGVESDLTNWYEGNPTAQITSRVVRRYDRYRNVTEYIHYGDTTHKDEYFRAVVEYATGMPHNLVSLPLSIVVYDDSDNILQLRTAEYNDSVKMTRLTRYSDHNHISQHDFSYDQFGNLETSTLPENRHGQRLSFEYLYDNTVHTYPVRVDNHSLQLFSTAEYDLRFGKPTRTTDMNNNEMRYEYDYLGRCKKILAPYEIAAGKPYTIKMEYNPKNYGENGINQQSFAKTFHYDPEHPDNPILTVILSDGLGRMLQTRKDAEIGGDERFIVSGRVVYDCFGRTVEQYQPFSDNTPYYTVYDTSCDSAKKTVFEYDILNRQTRVTIYPYNYTTNTVYGFGPVGDKTCFRTIVTDAKDNADTLLKGTMGQQLEQRLPMGVVTRFGYDHLGQLKQSTDPDGHNTFYDYNWLGQMTHRNHPDAGDDWYEYDRDGSMTCHVNAAGDSIKYKYYYNQLTDIEYPAYPANNVHYSYGSIADTATNSAGRIVLQEDGSGFQTFKYGKLGEVIENIRTFALPFEKQTYTFKMQYEYDSWNRIQKMIYPDGEVVHYDYNLGGMLEKVYGQCKEEKVNPFLPQPLRDSLIVQPMNMNMMGLDGGPAGIGPFLPYTTYTYRYIDSIAYNEFEQKSEVFYGNGTHTQYDYDSIQRLHALRSKTRAGVDMQDITYTYDAVGNITDIVNLAVALSNGLGGTYSHSHDYDDLYRLVRSTGQWDNAVNNEHLKDTVRMAYRKNGRIASKSTYADIYSEDGGGAIHTTQNRRRSYSYNTQQPNTLAGVYDSVTQQTQLFYWDVSGNMLTHRIPEEGNIVGHTWTEDNRLQTVMDHKWFSYYQYDAGGDRTYKLPYNRTISNRSGRISYYWAADDATLYASPYLVITPKGYTKHYYAESERITSQIGRGKFSTLTTPVTDTATANRKVRRADSLVLALNPAITDTAAQLSYLTALTNRQKDTCEAYWYHTDHLGSSSWITDSAGNPVQHLHYLPWGEDFVNQRTTDFSARFTFSAKEKDSETGLSYFGSRYYSSDLSIWLSVDPMSDKYASLSPYTYCADNPVKLVDPNGEDWYEKDGIMYYTTQYTSKKAFAKSGINGKYKGKYFSENGTYYGLFGDKIDIKSEADQKRAALIQKIDEAFDNYAKYIKASRNETENNLFDVEIHSWDYPTQKETDFGGIYTFIAHGILDNYHNPKELGYYAKVAGIYLFVSKNRMAGKFDSFSGGLQYGGITGRNGCGRIDGYLLQIKNYTQPNEIPIVVLQFPSAESVRLFHSKFKKLFNIR